LTPVGRLASISTLVCVLSPLVGLPACASRRPAIVTGPPPPPRVASLEEVLAAYDEHCEAVGSLSASGDLDVRDLRAGRVRKLAVRVLAVRGGRLYLKGSVAVVTAIELVADGDRFWLQVPSRRTVWTGRSGATPNPEDEGEPYYALRPTDVSAALLPEPLAPGPGDVLLLEADRQAFVLTQATSVRGVARRRVWLDRQTLRPLRSRTFDEAGDLQAEFLFSDWRGGGLPRRIGIRRPLDGYEADFVFGRLEPNARVPERVFVPRTPQDYAVVELGR
jgi:outer membrane lipoprotein-sorting protein